MSASTRRERVSFRTKGRVQRDDGGYDTTATTSSTVWAAVKPVAANEKEEAGRLFGSTSYLITILADDKPAGLTTGSIVRWETAPGGAVDFNLRAIRQPPRRPLELELVGEKGTALGV